MLKNRHQQVRSRHASRIVLPTKSLQLAGGGFQHGEHKVYSAEDSRRVPAANLLLSILQHHGLEIDQFGSSTGALPDFDWS